MNVLLIHQHFKLPEDGGGLRTYYLLQAMAQKGWKVQVLATSQKPKRDECNKNYTVHFFPIPYNNHFGLFQRALSFIKYVNACKKWIKSSNTTFDLGYVVSTPLTTAWIALFLKKKYSIPYVFEVGDLWPDVPIALGKLKNRWLKKYFYLLEKKVYSQANALVALSPPIGEIIKQKVSGVPVHISTNMCDLSMFSPNERDPERPFTIGYFGTLGYANNIPFILAIAQKMPHIRFIIMGDGLYKSEVLMVAKQVSNVVVYDWQGTKRVASRLRFCDAMIVSFLPNELLSTGCPNKVFDGLAAGKIIVFTYQSWLSDLLQTENCSIQLSQANMEEDIEKLNQLTQSTERVQSMKTNAHQLALKSYSVEQVTRNWLDFISSRFL